MAALCASISRMCERLGSPRVATPTAPWNTLIKNQLLVVASSVWSPSARQLARLLSPHTDPSRDPADPDPRAGNESPSRKAPAQMCLRGRSGGGRTVPPLSLSARLPCNVKQQAACVGGARGVEHMLHLRIGMHSHVVGDRPRQWLLSGGSQG